MSLLEVINVRGSSPLEQRQSAVHSEWAPKGFRPLSRLMQSVKGFATGTLRTLPKRWLMEEISSIHVHEGEIHFAISAEFWSPAKTTYVTKICLVQFCNLQLMARAAHIRPITALAPAPCFNGRMQINRRRNQHLRATLSGWQFNRGKICTKSCPLSRWTRGILFKIEF